MPKSVLVIIVAVVLLILAGCQSTPIKYSFENTEDYRICAMLYDVQEQKIIYKNDATECGVRTAPVSTFKIPLFLMAYQEGLINNSTTFKWDGKKHEIDSWNKDQTVRSWIQNSTVWVSQQLTQKLGKDKISETLKKLNYGNASTSGAVETFWLTKSTFAPNVDSSLKISAEEQLRFLTLLWEEKTFYPRETLNQLFDILRAPDMDQNGIQMYGKTGSGYMDFSQYKRLGWYVGFAKKNDKIYSYVLRIQDKKLQAEASNAGALAKEMARELIAAKIQ